MTPALEPKANDAAVRARIRTSLGESMIVEASAGTGKTTELVKRIVRVVASGVPVKGIVAVTFTNKAAGELKIRLRQELDESRMRAADDAERLNLEDALAHLEEASIGTIHSFCAQILRERPVEAKIDPEFVELTDLEAGRLLDRAFDQWFQERLNTGSPGLRRALARLAYRESWQTGTAIEQLKYAARALVEWRDFPAAWERKPLDRTATIDRLVDILRELAVKSQAAKRADDPLSTGLRPAREFVQWIDRAETAGPREYDTVEALLLKVHREMKGETRKGTGPFGEKVTRQELLDAKTHALNTLELFRKCASANLAAELRDEMQGVLDRYQSMKLRSGGLDFLDLLLMARDLVRGDKTVRGYLQRRFKHVFIDEFQDTDPLQAAILILLSSDDPDETDWTKVRPIPGKLFVVGDPKQSIYKFRRADVTLYRNVCEQLENRGVARLALTTSFRSVPPIQQMVNAAFEPEMTGDVKSGQSEYSPLEGFAPAYPSQPAVVALPAPRPYGSTKIAKSQIDACLPDAVAAFIEWMVKKSNWQVRDPLESDGKRVQIRARHICVLFRRFTNFGKDITREYVRSLESRNIPHLLVGSRSFHQREEVETLRAAISAIEWPDDELSVFATLKGALFAIPDDLLLRFRIDVARLHPFRPVPADLNRDLAPVGEALAVLADLHKQRNWRPIADTVSDLLEKTRAHVGFALRPAGAQVLANVSRVCDLARSFELSGGLSFRGFVEEFAEQAQKAESAEAPVLEEASDGVRLMTVHTAKGLEFSVVVLADMTANLTAAEPERYLDSDRELCATRLLRCAPWELLENDEKELARERAEGIRVAYVAATRARDLLVVPTVGDEERDGWLAPLNKAIYPSRSQYRRSTPPAGCPQFKGDATVLERPFVYANAGEFSVKPGLHSPAAGEHSVVWWDPSSLRLNVPETFGLHQEDILAAEPSDRATKGVERYQTWTRKKIAALQAGMKPQFQILNPSETLEAPPMRFSVTFESVEGARERPSGPRFGTLVHAVLRDVDFAAGASQIEALVAVQGRLLDASEEEMTGAKEAVLAALKHRLIDRARSAERCHRELPIIVRLDDARLVEGTADLAFLDSGAWTVVDFKTDAHLSTPRAQYERQLQWYAFALSKATGLAVAPVLLNI
jgi:ATP-dependent exoDNAse (exonuclease V) beta subunit